jgi:hypothetical protein
VDFREMLDKQKDIEAVFAATPDHRHAVIPMRAMEMGEHVACEKPLTRAISEQKQVWSSLGQRFAQTITGYLFRAAAKPVGLITDDQIPTGVDEVSKAFLVVRFQLFLRPSSPLFHRFDGINRADHLIELPPDVIGPRKVAPQRELTRGEEAKLLVEVCPHFLDLLGNETLRRNHQHSLHQPTEFQFPEDQPRFNGLSQADFIGQQVANLIFAHRSGDGVELVREWDDSSFKRSQQNILR